MTVTITGPAKANLRKFLEAAANSGVQCGGVDASYLFVELFENETQKVPGSDATAVTVKWPNGDLDLMWADELDPDRDEQRGGAPIVIYLVPRGDPPTASDALLAVLDRFDTAERGLPQASVAARLVAELRAAIVRAEPASTECTRSHPHEGMDALCALRTIIARLENEKARAAGKPPLAADHNGMRVDYRGLLRQSSDALRNSGGALGEMLRQLREHLTELGTRFYAGDVGAVDEFLQLYCIGRDQRPLRSVPAVATLKEQYPDAWHAGNTGRAVTEHCPADERAAWQEGRDSMPSSTGAPT